MNRWRWMYFVLFLAILLGFQNCGPNLKLADLFSANGTEIGNPGPQEPIQNPSRPSGQLASTSIQKVTCELLTRCRQELTTEDCVHQYNQSNGVAKTLGLPDSGAYDPFSNLVEAEMTGQVAFNPDALALCENEIANTQCSDSRLNAVFGDGVFNSAILYSKDIGSCASVFFEANLEP